MQQKSKIAAIFIAYNAEKTLEDFYLAFPKDLFNEIILVDDASKDGTFALAQKLGIRSYRNPVNRGYGGNLKRAFDIALNDGADIIVDIHPDGEYRTSAISPAIREVENGAEFVLGNRFSDKYDPVKNGMYVWKILPIMFLGSLCKIVLGLPINDYHQGFRVYTRKFLEKVNYKANSDDYSFSFELLAQAAFHKIKVGQVPVEVNYTGKKRGASLKNSIIYFLGTLKILLIFIAAKLGFVSEIFQRPH